MDFKREESHALTAGGGDGRDLSLMSALDYTAIEEMDPSIADGYRVIYDRETPFELRLQDSEDGPQEVGTLEPIKVKILILVRSPRRHGEGGAVERRARRRVWVLQSVVGGVVYVHSLL